MLSLGTMGNRAYSLMSGARGRAASASHAAMDLTEIGLGALGAGYLSAKSNINGGGGRFARLPIPVLLALVAGGAAISGVAGARSHDLMNVAKGAISAQLAMVGIKAAYSAAGAGPAMVAGVAGVPGVPPQVGATPGVESLLQQAGLMS